VAKARRSFVWIGYEGHLRILGRRWHSVGTATVGPVADFVNEPIEADSLPRLHDDGFEPVDPNWLRVSLLGMGLFAAAVTACGVTASLVIANQDGQGSWIPLAIAAALVVLTAISVAIRVVEVRYIAYQVRNHDISHRRGVLVRRVSTVPFVRVQHAQIRQGPLQRRYGIAMLEVNSAGPDLKIHGLPADIAEQLKALVVERAGDLTEDQ
jgi:membrane protein YdbS with pleckstrin-like domain